MFVTYVKCSHKQRLHRDECQEADTVLFSGVRLLSSCPCVPLSKLLTLNKAKFPQLHSGDDKFMSRSRFKGMIRGSLK